MTQDPEKNPSRSVYLQVADKICKSIKKGELYAFDRLPTETQLAQQIGVNRLTVSRGYGALQQQGIITQQRGQGSFVSKDAYRLLGLPPRRRLRNVAFVISTQQLADIPVQMRTIFLDILFGISARFEGLAINVCHVPLDGPAKLQQQWIESFDGFFLIDHSATMQLLIEKARQYDRPCVMAWSTQKKHGDLVGVPVVSYDRLLAVKLGMDHLIAQGYRKIGFIGSGLELSENSKPTGFVTAMKAHDLPIEQQWMLDVPPCIGGAYRVIRDFLAKGQPLPQAFFVDTDYKALEVMQVLALAGIGVPQDVAICGYDNIADAATSQPPLTSVRTPRQEMGYTAADILLNWLPDQPTPANVVLPSELIVRQTTPEIVCES